LEPLVEELQQLWQGVPAFDASETSTRPRSFTLHGICMWTMHDYPGEINARMRICNIGYFVHLFIRY
ncbi:hypothetical protein GMA12_18175, partial [Kocuria sediminis]|nr:hypothetical protein [Kocuria sediminis]